MKTLLAAVGLGLMILRSSAQVSIELELPQEQFLPSEAMPLAVKITNRSGQQIHLGADPAWLTFSVESVDGFVIIKKSEVPVTGEFDLESSQLAIKRVDLTPYFVMSKPGRYKIIATLRIKDWNANINSAAKHFDIVHGSRIWAQEFGVPSATNGAPEVRKFSLCQANYLRSQLRLYVQLSDAQEAQVFHAEALGTLVSFSQPEAQVDRTCQLHVLWQTGAQAFNYCLINPNGNVANREIYDNFNSRPHLGVNDNGEVSVKGGVRRTKPTELPLVKRPDELPAKVAP
jgi:hypothetical protein